MIFRYLFFVIFVFLALVLQPEMKDSRSGEISLSVAEAWPEVTEYATFVPPGSMDENEGSKTDFRLLFLGNSLTYTNDLPSPCLT